MLICGVLPLENLGLLGQATLALKIIDKKNTSTELLGAFNPSEKYQSMGSIIPYIMENKIHVPKRQPENVRLPLHFPVFNCLSIVQTTNPERSTPSTQHPPLEQRDTPHPGVGSAAVSRPGVRGEPMAIILGA